MVEEIDSGLIYYQKLQKIQPPIPIIFLTSLGGEIKTYFEMYEKTVEIIEKPVEPEKLLSAVKLKIN